LARVPASGGNIAVKIAFVFIGCLALTGALCASPARYPKRAIAGQPVNLTPLIRWWSQREGPRPLSAWVHATGRIIGTNAFGWTVEGRVDDESGKHDKGGVHGSDSKFILKTPPVGEMAEFYQLQAKFKQLTAERSQLNREIKSDNQREKKLSQQKPRYTRRGRIRARNASQQLNRARFDEQNAHERLDEIEKEIKQVEKLQSELPSGNTYTVDCFALKLNQEFRGVPIYDHGAVMK
jgi:hypothetical protein